MGPAGPNAIVSVTGVFVTRTTRDDAYDGMNVAWVGVDLPLGSYFVYDLSLPSRQTLASGEPPRVDAG